MGGWHLMFWEPNVSPHKLALFRALQRHPAIASCRYVAEVGLSAERAAQGWTLGTLDDVAPIIAPSAEAIDALAASTNGSVVHVFSGLRHQRIIVEGLRAVRRRGGRFILMSEPRASDGWRGKLRLAQSWAGEAPLRRHAAAVLAIGRNGPPWFRATGYPPKRIFPFAYFLSAPPLPPEPPRRDDAVHIGFLGRLTQQKGVGLLIDAFSLLPGRLRCEIAGIGPEGTRIAGLAAASGDRLIYRGGLPMNEVDGFLASIDILVQPSRIKDGWAAVVSEALLAGATAVATAKVGASILLDAPERGRVVGSARPEALAKAIAELAESGDFSPAARAARRDWALSRLTGEAGAAYLLAILAHLFEGAPRPAAFYA